MQTGVFKCANMPYHNLVLTILCFSVIASFHETSCTASHNGAGHSKVNFYCFSLHGTCKYLILINLFITAYSTLMYLVKLL